MTLLEEIQAKRAKLENDILFMLQKFDSEIKAHCVQITSAEINFIETIMVNGRRNKFISSVEIELTI